MWRGIRVAPLFLICLLGHRGKLWCLQCWDAPDSPGSHEQVYFSVTFIQHVTVHIINIRVNILVFPLWTTPSYKNSVDIAQSFIGQTPPLPANLLRHTCSLLVYLMCSSQSVLASSPACLFYLSLAFVYTAMCKCVPKSLSSIDLRWNILAANFQGLGWIKDYLILYFPHNPKTAQSNPIQRQTQIKSIQIIYSRYSVSESASVRFVVWAPPWTSSPGNSHEEIQHSTRWFLLLIDSTDKALDYWDLWLQYTDFAIELLKLSSFKQSSFSGKLWLDHCGCCQWKRWMKPW